jgi:hypothetical protein
MLTVSKKSLFQLDIEEKLVSQSNVDKEAESYLEFQLLSPVALNKLTVDKLKDIRTHYQQTYSNMRKTELIEQVRKGLKEVEIITEVEQFPKKTFISPLADKDQSAWRLGSLDEDEVCSVMSAVVSEVGGEFIDGWKYSLLRNKDDLWLATSLDWWLHLRLPRAVFGDLDDIDTSQELVTVDFGLEIKTPPGLKVLLRKIRPALDLHGCFSRCSFGVATCKVLVYSVAYRFQVLHHATVANLNYILFVVTDETT